MKKFSFALLILIVSVVVAGCSRDTKVEFKSVSTEGSPTTMENTVLPDATEVSLSESSSTSLPVTVTPAAPSVSDSTSAQIDKKKLIQPAVAIIVTSVSSGTTVTSSPVVISGVTGKSTIEVTVNGWKLQNYQPGSEQWSYIAKPEFSNLVVGENKYEITAKDAGGIEATTVLNFNYVPDAK